MMAETPPLMASRIVPAPDEVGLTTVANEEFTGCYIVIELGGQTENFAIDKFLSVLDLISTSWYQGTLPSTLVHDLVVPVFLDDFYHGWIVHLLEQRVERVRSNRYQHLSCFLARTHSIILISTGVLISSNSSKRVLS